MDDAVQTCVGSGEGEVDWVLGAPLVGPVVAAEASDAVLLREDLVEGFHALAFHPAELVQGDGFGYVGVLEAHPVHADGDVESPCWVGPHRELLFEPVGGEGVGEDARVGADAARSDADDAGAVAGEGGQGRGGDGHAWAEERAGQSRGGDVDEVGAVFVDLDLRAHSGVVLYHADHVQVQEGQGVRDAGEHGQGGGGEASAYLAAPSWRAHAVVAGARLSSPAPYGLPRPMPWMTASLRASGSVTVAVPS